MRQTVKALSEHLKSKPFFGVLLVQKQGMFTIHFDPILGPKDLPRTKFAEEAIRLLMVAKEDLREMVNTGDIKIRSMV